MMKIKTKDQCVITAAEFNKTYKKKTKTRHEEKIQLKVCEFLKKNYNVIFMCDLASGMNLGKKIGGMNTRLRSSRGLPDLFIAHAVRKYGDIDKIGQQRYEDYYGLFLELKNEGVVVKLKNGELPANIHLQEQAHVLNLLREQGYKAEFAVGYDEAVKIIKEYLG